ncbi:MAG: FG-GAP-like repeat-containing protein [Desulfobacterales bacterium]|nr:FG-GAP-like repeat-containing protein [Desulfobacterales bacterium]
MKNRYSIFVVAIFCLTVFGYSQVWANEAYLMATDEYGNNYYMGLNGDGSLTGQVPKDNTGWSPYGNGIGDFDNDGDFDYIVASGDMSVYLFKKLDTGDQFASPAAVAFWSFNYFQVGEIAVADFNGDGDLDFVLTYFWSQDAELFLGNGQLGFGDPILLPGSTPFDSYGADAADFDNDGYFDFVSAPAETEALYQLYLNFGGKNGKFTTVKIDCNKWYMGVAAADFNGDGNVDIAASTTGAIDIYWGDGKRNFSPGPQIVDPKIWNSPMDSYDIDGDGQQDLILGSYGDSVSGAADVVAALILSRDEEGRLFVADIQLLDGVDGYKRIAIAAPAPPKALLNEDPVAVIEPSELYVEVGQPAEFTAKDSEDPDGEIVSYSWDFGDVEPAAVLSVASVAAPVADGIEVSHIYQEPGDYTITLTVTDKKGATNSITAVAHVAAPQPKIKGRAIFMPETLNLKSKGSWVKAYIKLPQQYRSAELHADDLYLFDPETGDPIAAASYVRYKKWWGVYVVKFDRQAIISHIGESEKRVMRVPLQVIGELYQEDGPVGFEANGKINAYKPKSGKKNWRSFWQQVLTASWNYRR